MEEKLYEVLNKINPDILKNKDKDLLIEGVIDSFDIVTMVVEIEEAFGITFSIEEIVEENFSKVANIEKLLDVKLQ